MDIVQYSGTEFWVDATEAQLAVAGGCRSLRSPWHFCIHSRKLLLLAFVSCTLDMFTWLEILTCGYEMVASSSFLWSQRGNIPLGDRPFNVHASSSGVIFALVLSCPESKWWGPIHFGQAEVHTLYFPPFGVLLNLVVQILCQFGYFYYKKPNVVDEVDSDRSGPYKPLAP